MKKLISLLLALVLICTLAGCGGSPAPTATTPPTATPEPIHQVDKEAYIGRTGLETYKELQEMGYNVSVRHINDTVARIYGDFGELFEKTSLDDLESIDAFLVSDIIQDGYNIELLID